MRQFILSVPIDVYFINHIIVIITSAIITAMLLMYLSRYNLGFEQNLPNFGSITTTKYKSLEKSPFGNKVGLDYFGVSNELDYEMLMFT